MIRNNRKERRFRRGQGSRQSSASRIDSMVSTVDQLAQESEAITSAPRHPYIGAKPASGPPPVRRQTEEIVAPPMQVTSAPQNQVPEVPNMVQHGEAMIDSVTVNIKRVLAAAEDEANVLRARVRRESELANERSVRMVAQAQEESDAIREHAQKHAQNLLGEVEQIIAETQASSQEILAKANVQANDIIADAKVIRLAAVEESRAIIDDARSEGENIIVEQRQLATIRAQEALREYERLRDQVRKLENRRHEVLQSLEPLIDQLSKLTPTTAR